MTLQFIFSLFFNLKEREEEEKDRKTKIDFKILPPDFSKEKSQGIFICKSSVKVPGKRLKTFLIGRLFMMVNAVKAD